MCVCVCVRPLLFYCVSSVLMEFKYKWLEDLQMQFDKNAYHFKWKIMKLYWNTNENVNKQKKIIEC